jgi:hypothetical protein
MPPLFREALSEGPVVRERAINVHFVGRGEKIRRAEIGERVVGSRLRSAREDTHKLHTTARLKRNLRLALTTLPADGTRAYTPHAGAG